MLRRFILLRVEDVSGSSGTGVVARGVVGSNGWVVMFWADSMKFFPNVDAMMAVHSHEGRTRFHWQDPEKEERPKAASFESVGEPFLIQGRGTVYSTYSEAGDDLPNPGDLVLLDQRPFQIEGVERQGLYKGLLKERRTGIGLMGKFVEPDAPSREWFPCPPPKKNGLYLLRKDAESKPVVVYVHPEPEKNIVPVIEDLREVAEEEGWSPETFDEAVREQHDDYVHWTIDFGPSDPQNYFSVDEINQGEWSPLRQRRKGDL